MTEIVEKIKEIAIEVSEAIKKEDASIITSTNMSGDTQIKLDVVSDKIIEKHFLDTSSIIEIISEEKKLPVKIDENGEYLIAYDPLDGSSLVDVNLSVGSIFGIYRGGYSGESIVASVYVVYGPRVEMVIARDNVELFRLDEKTKEFKYIKELKLKEKGKIVAPGGTQKNWPSHHKDLIKNFFKDGYRLRYSGGMVPDLHQILLKGGGIFAYPATSDREKGKLRKLFEVFPFAYIFEKAGGLAIDGNKDLLSLDCKEYHETTPCFFGSDFEIKRVLKYYDGAKNG